MSSRKLRYSERKRVAETGSLGDLVSDTVPVPLLIAFTHALKDWGQRQIQPGVFFDDELTKRAVAYFGRSEDAAVYGVIQRGEVGDFLDLIEIAIELAHPPDGYSRVTIPDIAQTINELFERHRFGFRIEAGEARPLLSPALDVEVVGPALLAAQQPGWSKVEDDYREAILHLRSGEVGLALNSAHAAVESALKALGFKGASLSDLVKEFRKSDLAKPYLASGLDQMTQVLGKLTPLRGEGEAHGQAPDADEPPPEFAALAIHTAGAFLVFLAEAARKR
ncbi:MAG: hypothetical protein AB7I08_12280 [Thermoleophilia bacterium]